MTSNRGDREKGDERMVDQTSLADRPSRSQAVRLNLLGGFELTAAGERCEISDNAGRLLVYLALRERPQCRTVVAASLWPDKTERRASANLRGSLWRLPQPGGFPLVDSAGTNIGLSKGLEVDVRLAEAAGWSLIGDPSRPVDDVDPEVFLLELLPGWYDDWVAFERERITQLQLRFLEALTYALVERSRFTKALDVALRLVNADPLREPSQRALLAVYQADGSIQQAHRQFERYRRLIRETFGCDPSPSLRAMVVNGG